MRKKGGGGKKDGRGGCGGAVKVKRDAEAMLGGFARSFSLRDLWIKGQSSTQPTNITTTTEISSKTFDEAIEFPVE